MKYIVLIIDGAAGHPLPEHGGRTCLEIADTPNLDGMTEEGALGLVRTVPPGMEPSSACACMSVIGYDPTVYYMGRAAIESKSMGIDINEGEVAFRCNLVAVRDGKMLDYSAGHISSPEAELLVASLNEKLGSDDIIIYPGIGYRHIMKLKGNEEALQAVCTPPHDIPGRPVADYLPRGDGSAFLRDLMARSEEVLKEHPVNLARESRGEVPASMIWLFWGSGPAPEVPGFNRVYGINAAVTSAVDIIRGLALMTGMGVLDIKGVSDGLDNDYAAQADGALNALGEYDLVVIHVEAPDEAGHAGSIDEKIEAIRRVDNEIVSRLRIWRNDNLRLLVMPDHPTPIEIRTHTGEPVPFMVWGKSVKPNGARRFTEAEAAKTGLFIEKGYTIMGKLVGDGRSF